MGRRLEQALPDEEDYEGMLQSARVNSRARREQAAKSLMKLVAIHLQTDVPLPRPVRNWLSKLLIAGSISNTKVERLVWTATRGRQGNPHRNAEEYAHVYALMLWGWTQAEAAQNVAILFTKEKKNTDSAATKKRSNEAKTEWIAEGPFRSLRPDDEPPEATEQHLRDGEDIFVELIPRRGRRQDRTLYIPIRRAVLSSATKYPE